MKEKQLPKIGIIGGTGKMGQWFTYFFQNQGLSVAIAGRNTKLTPKQLAKQSDIIIVSVPISETASIISEVASFVKREALIADVSSLKVLAMEAMEDINSGTLGMHPLFGPSVTDARGMQIVFCRQKDNMYVAFLKKIFEKAGITVVEMSADEHDYQMAYIQAMTHMMNLVFGKIAFDRKQELSTMLHTPIFALQSLIAGRVLQQDLKMVAEIEMYNPYFPQLFMEFIKLSETVLSQVQNKKEKDFVELFGREQELAAEFSQFATHQTNKILQLAKDTPTELPHAKTSAIKLSKTARIGYLGPEGTYSHQATLTLFPKKENSKVPVSTLHELFTDIFMQKLDYAIIPAENSTEGTVRETLDYLIDFSLYIAGSFDMPVHHQLLSKEKKLSAITTVVSHPQALAQCRNFLKSTLPQVALMSSASTTENLLSPKKNYAYIASEVAAKKHDMPIIAKNIEDNKHNTTRFYVLSKNPGTILGLRTDKSLIFLTVYNRVGILRDILDVFAQNNLNLSKLESRPSRDKIWDYHFFVEVDAKPSDKKLKRALGELEKYCPIIRILGVT